MTALLGCPPVLASGLLDAGLADARGRLQFGSDIASDLLEQGQDRRSDRHGFAF